VTRKIFDINAGTGNNWVFRNTREKDKLGVSAEERNIKE